MPFLDRTMPILVVDDYDLMRDVIGATLRKIGFTDIDFAEGGEQALAALDEKKYGLVISDMMMKPMSGLDLLRAIRADEARSGLRVLLTTAYSNPKAVVAARKAGVDTYLLKPFTADALRDKIAGMIAR